MDKQSEPTGHWMTRTCIVIAIPEFVILGSRDLVSGLGLQIGRYFGMTN